MNLTHHPYTSGRPSHRARRTNGKPARARTSVVNPRASRESAVAVLGGEAEVARIGSKMKGTNRDVVLAAKLPSDPARSGASKRFLKGQRRRGPLTRIGMPTTDPKPTGRLRKVAA